MSEDYKLTYSGLVSAISSSTDEPTRLLLLQLLGYAGGDRSFAEHGDKDNNQIQSLITSLLAEGYLSKVDAASNDQKIITTQSEFVSQLETLSVNGKIILSDAHGLILASSGYSQSDSEYIAAIARNLVQISEQAKARIKKQTEKKLWSTGLSWGDVRALCLSIFVGQKQYIMIVGGLPNLEKSEFFDVVGFLVRRYGYG